MEKSMGRLRYFIQAWLIPASFSLGFRFSDYIEVLILLLPFIIINNFYCLFKRLETLRISKLWCFLILIPIVNFIFNLYLLFGSPVKENKTDFSVDLNLPPPIPNS